VALKHKLSNASLRIPELHTAIFGTGQDPVVVIGKGNAENEVLLSEALATSSSKYSMVSPYFVSFKGPDTASGLTWSSTSVLDVPHLDSLVETAGNELAAVRSKGNRVDAVGVAILSLETSVQATISTPNAHTLVEGACSDPLVVRGDGNGGDTVLDAELHDLRVGNDIPETHALITASRGNDAAVASEIKRIDVLVMALEPMSNLARLNIPDLQSLSASAVLHPTLAIRQPNLPE
jgi:hypothetical protein